MSKLKDFIAPIGAFFEKIFSRDFLFTSPPKLSGRGLYFWLIFFGALAIISFVVWGVFKRPKKVVYEHLRDRIFYFLFTASILGLTIVFFRSQALNISTNLISLLFTLIMLIWLGFVIFWLIAKFPNELWKLKEETRIKQYLKPKKKKK